MKTNASVAIAAMVVVASCAGPSPTLARYSDAQIKRCMNSLTFKEQQQIQAEVMNTALIPFVGAFAAQEAQFKEAEKICKRKGII